MSISTKNERPRLNSVRILTRICLEGTIVSISIEVPQKRRTSNAAMRMGFHPRSKATRSMQAFRLKWALTKIDAFVTASSAVAPLVSTFGSKATPCFSMARSKTRSASSVFVPNQQVGARRAGNREKSGAVTRLIRSATGNRQARGRSRKKRAAVHAAAERRGLNSDGSGRR